MNPASTSDLEIVQASLLRLKALVPETPLPEVMLSRLMLHLGRGMSAMLEQQIRPFGLAEAEFRVLTTLFSEPGGAAHPTDLCRRTSQSPANMSRISDALVSRELITRVLSSLDRRRMVLRITDTGTALVRRLLPLLFAPLREMFKDFSEAEQVALVSQLKRVAWLLDELMARGIPGRSE